MRKLILWNLTSLEGFFNGPTPWSFDWPRPFLDPEFHAFALEQLRSADALLFGRVTYEGMAAYWPTATDNLEVARFMNTLPKFVFTRTLQAPAWNNTEARTDAAAAVAQLKREGDGNLFVFGSGSICRTLLAAGLVDEVRLCVVPLLLGTGEPLFSNGAAPVDLAFLESKQLPAGAVILRYGVR